MYLELSRAALQYLQSKREKTVQKAQTHLEAKIIAAEKQVAEAGTPAKADEIFADMDKNHDAFVRLLHDTPATHLRGYLRWT